MRKNEREGKDSKEMKRDKFKNPHAEGDHIKELKIAPDHNGPLSTEDHWGVFSFCFLLDAGIPSQQGEQQG